jgi:hypothetical protein
MTKNKWLEFDNKFVRKSAITGYIRRGSVVEIYSQIYSHNKQFETEEEAIKYLNYIHDQLRDS